MLRMNLSTFNNGRNYEEKNTNYKEQEDKVFQINREVKSLITELESKEKND